MKDLDKFRGSLLSYLQAKNIDVSRNPIFCFNPDHTNIDTEAMTVYNNRFKCMGSCGVRGDVYDACRIIEGITDMNEQYLEVEKTLTGFNESGIKPIKRQETIINPECSKKIERFILDHKGREKGVNSFLKERGYSDELSRKIKGYYGYWPGMEEAKKVFDEYTLTLAGIPEYAWYHSGVVCKLNSGYKLLWYGTYKDQGYGCHKFNSKAAKPFPAPFAQSELKGTIIVTEAETSAISMRGSGFKNVFSSGSVQGITKYNSNLLEKCDKIILAFDGDIKGNAGQYYSGLAETLIDKNTQKETTPKTTPQKIYENGFEGEIYGVKIPLGKDPDDMIRENSIDELKQCINEAVLIVKTEKIDKTDKTEKPESKKRKSPAKKGKEDNPFRFLGFDKRYYYFFPKIQKIVYEISRGDNSIKNHLFELAEKSYWYDHFMGEFKKNGVSKSFLDKDMAMEWIRGESFKKGIFDPNRIKGVGAHLDDEKILINTGTNLKVSSTKFIDYDDFNGENTYVQSTKRFKIKGKPWDHKEGKNLWKQVNTFSFEKKLDPICIIGFMTISPFSGILFRRPGLWVTAASGVGKSTIFKELLIPAAGGEKMALICEGLSSEAFVRQELEKDFITVFIDEFEAHNPKDKMIIDSILKLNRSSYGGGMAGKGSTGHKPIRFLLRSMFCFGSVGVNIDVQADDSRIHVCRMKESKGKCKAPESYDGLRVRTFSKLSKILKDIDNCKHMMMSQGLGDRISDTYSPFIASAWNTMSDNPFMEGEETKLIQYFDEALYELSMKESIQDEDKIIRFILQQILRIDGQEQLTIAEMLTFTRKDNAEKEDANWYNIKGILPEDIIHYKEIQRHGLKRYRMKDNVEVLAISLISKELKSFLKDTAFSDYQEILQRSSLVINKSHNVRMSGFGHRSIIFDWKKFKEKYLDVTENT